MDTNTILLIVGGIILGLVVGFIVAKSLEKSNASKLIKNAKYMPQKQDTKIREV